MFTIISSCLLCVGCKALLYYEFDMHRNAKTPPPCDVTWLQAGGMSFVPTGHRLIKSWYFNQAGDNAICTLFFNFFFYKTRIKHRTVHSFYTEILSREHHNVIKIDKMNDNTYLIDALYTCPAWRRTVCSHFSCQSANTDKIRDCIKEIYIVLPNSQPKHMNIICQYIITHL